MPPTRRRLLVFCVALVAVSAIAVAGTAAAHGPGGAAPAGTLASSHVDECAATPPPDHAPPDAGSEDVIGWVDGFWYNQSVEIADPEELTEEELEALTARTAARVEALRCLTFSELPPLEMVTREERSEEIETFFEEEVTEEDAQFANAQLAAMLVVGTEEDAIEVMIENRAAFAAAFYDVEEQFMAFVTDEPDEIEVDQTILAHELVHALQDQHFDIETVFEEDTTDEFMSSLALVEGEAVLVDEMYEDNCGEWVDECIRIEPDPPTPPNWALTVEQVAAYHTPLVAHVHRDEGWEGVNALHDRMPNSMVEALDPDAYGEFERTPLTVPDRSGPEWERLTSDGQEYDIVGQHGLTAILVAPSYETGGAENVIDPDPFIRDHVGGALDFNHPATSGWQGDELYTYATAEGDLGTVWKLAWSDADEAERFADAYVELIEFRGGERSAEYANVYTFEGNDAYDMAIGVERADDRVWIVMAPSVDELADVHADLAKTPAGTFAVTAVSPTEAALEPGERLELSVTVENVGGGAAHEMVEAEFDGEAFEVRSVELEPGETATVTFELDPEGIPPGSYEIDVLTESDASTATVTIEEAPDDAVADDAVAPDDGVVPGFGVVAGLLGLAAVAYLLRRR